MLNKLQEILHTEIPLTRSIGLKVRDYSDQTLSLSAPIEKNLNHKCTAFGGSLYSVSVLSGWGLIYLLMEENGLSGHIVIQESHTKFLKPVESDIISSCSFNSAEQYEKFLHMYRRKGRARIRLTTSILSNAEVSVVFEGSYVVHS